MIAPSTDPAKTVEDIITYADEIKEDADMLHCDIMDGKFVESKTYSFDVLKEINSKTLLPLDVHLMVEKPTKIIDSFIASGANILTLHYEAYSNKKDLIKDLKRIKTKGALAGLSIKPQTNVSEIISYLCFVDLILFMSVEPGKSGQKFLDSTYAKIVQLNQIKSQYNIDLKIEVDGGVLPEISKKLKSLGVNIIVSGSYVYNSKDRAKAIRNLR